MRIFARVACALALTATAAYGSDPAALTVMVSIPPQIEIVERVGGDLVTVEVLIPPGTSPTTYEPSPRQLATLARADALIPVGVPFERQIMRRIGTINPDLMVCAGAPQDAHAHTEPLGAESRGANVAHDHGEGPDPHFWLDPMGATEHAEIVSACLCAAAPDHCSSIQARLTAYRAELETVDREIARQLEPLAGKTVLVFHPAFGHFTTRYGLQQLAIERDGKEPSARHLAEIITLSEALGVRVIFVQPQFAGSSVYAVADAIGATIVELDPLAPDLIANLKRIADTIHRELGGAAVGKSS